MRRFACCLCVVLAGCYVDPFGVGESPEAEEPAQFGPLGDDDENENEDEDENENEDENEDDDEGDDDEGDDDDANSDDDDDDAAPEVPADDAVIVASNLPASLECGEAFTAQITLQNTGSATWYGTEPDLYKLGAVDDEDPLKTGDPRIWMGDGAVVPPGASFTFDVPLVAPAEAGTYVTDWRMVHEWVTWFGETAASTVTVECPDPVWVQLACARNGAEICDDELFGVDAGTTYGLECVGANSGIGYVATNTGPEQSDGVTRCQGWEDQGLDAWDYLDYVDSFVCDTPGEVLELDLSPWAGGYLWFGSHDNPSGGGHMTNICLVELVE